MRMYSSGSIMFVCNTKYSVRWILPLLLVSFSIYLCLFHFTSGCFGAIRGNSVCKVDGDLHMSESNDGVRQPHAGKNKESRQSPGSSRPSTLTQHKTNPLVSESVNNTLLRTFKSRILSNSTLPLLTLFTTWNANPDKYIVHNLTLINWRSFLPNVIPVVFTNESSVINECNKAGVTALPLSNVAADGIPVLKYMFRLAMNHSKTSLYAFSNSDILYTDTLIRTLAQLINSTTRYFSRPVLIVGCRTNVDNVTLEEGLHWENSTRISQSRGKQFTDWAVDYFITSPSFPWNEVPEVVIRRLGYDNWLVYNSRKMKYNVIDATKTILAVHQTTLAGNNEGRNHSNRDYNLNLLKKMYKGIQYKKGVVGCIEMYTQYESKQFQVKTRKVHFSCKV